MNNNLLAWHVCDDDFALKFFRPLKCFHKLSEAFSCANWIILVHNMAHIVQHLHLEFTHHVSDCELFIHPVRAGQEQDFRLVQSKEIARQSFEPTNPVILWSHEVSPPHIMLRSIFFSGLDNLSWHRNSCGFDSSDCLRCVAVLNHWGEIFEGSWSFLDDIFHVRKSVHGGTFNHIDDVQRLDSFFSLRSYAVAVDQKFNSFCCDWSSHRVSNKDYRSFWVFLNDQVVDLDCILDQSFDR